MKRPILPLTILLATMRRKWADGDTDGATTLAKVVVPYVHARQSAVGKIAKPSPEANHLTDEELAIRLAAFADGAEDPHGDPH